MNAVRDKFPALIRAIAAMTISGPMGTRNAVACALLLSTACGGSPENYGAADQAFERSEKHPASRYLRRTQEPRPVDATQSPEPILAALERRVSVGALREPPEVVFGRIKDVATDEMGRLFLLDDRFGEVRVFDKHGNWHATIGRSGEGPGEFASPQSVAVAGHQVYVGTMHREVHVFRLQEGVGTYERTLEVDVPVTDLCVLGDELVLHGLRPGDYSILRFYDLRSGELLRTSGAIYRSGTEIVDLQIAEGFITCDPAEGAVYHAPRGLLGEVRRFERSGAESWIALVPDFKPIWYGVVEGGGAVVIPPPGAGFDRVEALGFLPDGSLVLTVANITRASIEEGRTYAGLRTYAIDPETGAGRLRGHESAIIHGTTVDGLVVTVTPVPFPSFALWSETGATRDFTNRVR